MVGGDDGGRSPDGGRSRNPERCLRISSREAAVPGLGEEREGGGGGSLGIRRGWVGGDLSRSLMSLNKEE